MKKTFTLKNIALAMLLTVPVLTHAQEQPRKFGKYPLTPNSDGFIRCATDEYELTLQEKHSKRATEAQFEEWMSQKLAERKQRKGMQKNGTTIITIPVVVHVVYYGSDLPGNNENISLEQVQSQIQVLNQDFRKMAGTPGDGFGVDTMIQFTLAQVDPNGDPTDGVDRYQTNVNKYTTNEALENLKMFTIWDPSQYFNMWTVDMGGGEVSGLLGYAQFPDYNLEGLNLPGQATNEYTDGVVINYKNFGSADLVDNPAFNPPYQYGRTATHETGHFLGLRHIWGDQGNCQGSDYCDDTPRQNDKTQGSPCLWGAEPDTCPQIGFDMFQNYMDYTNDECMSVFTQDQLDRMIIILENAPRRQSLVTSTVGGPLSTAEHQMLAGTRVYPNPAQNILNITVDNGELPDNYTVYNSIGQTIANVKVTGDANLTVNTSAYSNGIYFIKVDKGNESKTIRFIKN